jgi:hypothetical protein
MSHEMPRDATRCHEPDTSAQCAKTQDTRHGPAGTAMTSCSCRVSRVVNCCELVYRIVGCGLLGHGHWPRAMVLACGHAACTGGVEVVRICKLLLAEVRMRGAKLPTAHCPLPLRLYPGKLCSLYIAVADSGGAGPEPGAGLGLGPGYYWLLVITRVAISY